MNFTIHDNSDAVIRALKAQCIEALQEIGEKAVSYAKAEVQKAGRVDTGKLQGSIRYEVREDGVYVGTDNEYAAFHELGTGHYTTPHASAKYGVKPVHFLHHAASRHKAQYAKILKKKMKGL